MFFLILLSLAVLDIWSSHTSVTFCPKHCQYSLAQSNYSYNADILTRYMLILICILSPLEINLVHCPVFIR